MCDTPVFCSLMIKPTYCQFELKTLVMRNSGVTIRLLCTIEAAFTRVKMRAVIQKMFYYLHISFYHILLSEKLGVT